MDKFSNTKWNDVSKIDTQSETHLEEDTGYGEVALIRRFEFAANPEAFKLHTPSKQELFNYHAKAIEVMLWKDGLTIMPDIAPRLSINKRKTKYHIFVGAKPQRGHLLKEQPKTLSQIAHNL